ncbi:hypothetical protein C1637_06080 [Chryseobacterium lactis]|uniref:SnoaL-like domain-containing protein n=1 Tax=Chryseobacterium lactis TaxID=1241981 RepID=A0A3G6RJ01_CHRLC|nr:nuclear transport factor 2 family protein [Chryseobacterium lactis]AZA84407.1 hypothetical protein EG342_22050 [Chryseobacterium lactis]AZB04795.1 hypothetical protein EG341_12930 [Chryseobacterium lactis]PNW14526.1 hypothetical protein C1637_06080 [Chryseobacterium lactis]
MNSENEIKARYRAYCDACESGHLEKLENFWKVPTIFVVNDGAPGVAKHLIKGYDELVSLYRTMFDASTGVDQTVITKQDVTMYGNNLGIIQTELEHYAGERLDNIQKAIYHCVKENGEWYFVAHLSDIENK